MGVVHTFLTQEVSDNLAGSRGPGGTVEYTEIAEPKIAKLLRKVLRRNLQVLRPVVEWGGMELSPSWVI